MKTFLGIITGVFVGAIGFTALLLVTEESDVLLRQAKDYCKLD